MSDWALFLILLIASLIIQGFYSMLEMACVSFNRVRLQYYVSQKNKRAQWLSSLLNHPTRLFGTTLIGVNAAMQFGSECARRFYATININPDWAPLTQVIIVLVFAELVPIFAARRFAESVTMLGIPLLYLTSLIMRPVIFVLDLICRSINHLFGIKTLPGFLNREELQKAIEDREDMSQGGLDPILSNIFSLKTKTAKDLMDPITQMKCISSEASIGDLKSLLGLEVFPFVPIYHRNLTNIVAIAYPRDLLRLSEETRLRVYCRPAWFITEKNSILEIMKEFRLNSQNLAIVLNDQGVATGTLTLDAVVDEIFGQRDDWVVFGEYSREKHKILVDRSFPGNTLVADINKWLHIQLSAEEDETLENVMERHLSRRLDLGDVIRIEGFELSVEEASLIMGRTILIRSIS